MKSRILVIFLLFPLAVYADPGDPYLYRLGAESRVSIHGKSNINQFTCIFDSHMQKGTFEIVSHPNDQAMHFSDPRLNLQVSAFDCGKEKMNHDFRSLLESKNNPYIQIKLLEIRPAGKKNNGSNIIIAKVEITIRHVSKTTEVTLSVDRQDELRFHISGNKKLMMSDFGIEPPTALLGLVKVSDEINIAFNMILETNLVSGNY